MNEDQIFSTVIMSAIGLTTAGAMLYYLKVMIDDNPFKKQKN